MEAQREVLIAFFGAFAGFSAFGAVIATFLASSNALPWLGALWGGHALQEAAEEGQAAAAGFWTRNRRAILVWAVGGGIGLAALVSCVGLVISFFWLRASTTAHGVSAGWEYRWAGVLLVIEVLLITLITLLVTLSAAWFAIQQGPKTIEIYQQAQQAALKHASAHGAEEVNAQPTLRPAEPFAGPTGKPETADWVEYSEAFTGARPGSNASHQGLRAGGTERLRRGSAPSGRRIAATGRVEGSVLRSRARR